MPIDITAVNDRFHQLHERAYTFRLDSPTEIVNFHIVGIVPTTKPALKTLSPSSSTPRVKETRQVDYDQWGLMTSAVYERAELFPGMPIHGPAIIEEPAATTVIAPGMTAEINRIGSIVIDTGTSR
jgi:N-methylhydantoinase A